MSADPEISDSEAEHTIRVLLFAGAAEIMQSRCIDITARMPVSVSALADKIATRHPQLKALVGISRWAVDGQFVADEANLDQADDVAMVPPVGGG